MFDVLFGQPYTEASGASDLSDVYDCSLNGLTFRFDREHDAFKNGGSSIPMLRNQIDASADPGGQSINHEELWRRTQDNWYKGAGQHWRDKDNSDPNRFWASKGIDPWTQWQLSLLRDTSRIVSQAAQTQLVMAVGSYLYTTHDNFMSFTQGGGSTVVNRAAPAITGITSMTTDGYNIWFVGGQGIEQTTKAGSSATNYGTNPSGGNYYKVAYVRQRLLAADRQFLYEITAGGAAPTALNNSFGNSDWRWTSIAEGTSHIYAAGYSGDKSQIFQIDPLQNDPAQALGPPVAASPPLPTGEIVNVIYGYLDMLIIGTSLGVRVANVASTGALQIGALIEIPGGVTALEGSGRYVWFSWTNFDAQSTGLGRLDLSTFSASETEAPAYASDLMASTQGAVNSIATFQGVRYFSVSGQGVYAESNRYVSSGWLQSGRIGYGMIDAKVAKRVDVRHEALSGSIEAQLSVDTDDFVSLGTNSLAGSVEPVQSFDALEKAGEHFEMKLIVNAPVDQLSTPVIKQFQLRVFPSPDRGYSFAAPLMLIDVDSQFGYGRHPLDDFRSLISMVNYNRSVPYNEGDYEVNVVVEDFEWTRVKKTRDKAFYTGTFAVKLKVVAL